MFQPEKLKLTKRMTKQERITRITIAKNSDLLNALKKMDETVSKLLLVFDGSKFIGVLSVGDVQRAIISNKPLSTHVCDVMRKEITLATSYEDLETVKQRMLKHRTELMPVVDLNEDLVDVYFWDDFFQEKHLSNVEQLNIPVVIMAGGKGTRLKPITNIIPKPLIPLGEKPIIEEIVDRFYELGVTDFFLSVNYKHEMIKLHFDSLLLKKYKLNYVIEDIPLGTGGSLYLIKDQIKTTFFVSNCDIIINQDYSEIYKYHKAHENELTIVAALKYWTIPYGTLETKEDGELVSLKEKPEIVSKINTGMYILEPHLLQEIPDNTFWHITDLIERILERGGKVGVFPVSQGAWFDIGEWKEYNSTMKKLGFDFF